MSELSPADLRRSRERQGGAGGTCDAARFFLAAALLFGAALVVVTAPFHVPDEPAHFYRAVAISEGTLTAEALPGRTGATLPASLGALVDLFAESIAHPERGIDPGILAAARRIELEPEARSFLDFPTTAVTTPLSYLPQAAGVAAGRLFGAPTLVLLYLARLANLLAATALIHAGLRRLPAYRWLGVAIALTPMATFLRSSVSADALTFAIAFLFAATVARLAFGIEATVRPRDVALLCLLAAALCLTKAVYAPLVLAAAVIPVRRLRYPGRAILAYTLATAGAFILAALTARPVETPLRPGVVIDSDQQVAGAVRDPLRFLEVAARSYGWYGPRYAEELIGRLGWLNTPLPRPLLISYMVLLLGLLIADTKRQIAVAAWQRAVLAGATLATMLLISAALYALFMPVGSGYIAGVQGRYFLPIAPVAVWAFHGRRWGGGAGDRSPGLGNRWLGVVTALCCALALAVSLAVLIRRYDL